MKNATTGVVSTFAGRLPCGYSGDGGTALNAQFKVLTSIAFDAAGNAYVTDPEIARFAELMRRRISSPRLPEV